MGFSGTITIWGCGCSASGAGIVAATAFAAAFISGVHFMKLPLL
jgi:hypothetical protein